MITQASNNSNLTKQMGQKDFFLCYDNAQRPHNQKKLFQTFQHMIEIDLIATRKLNSAKTGERNNKVHVAYVLVWVRANHW